MNTGDFHVVYNAVYHDCDRSNLRDARLKPLLKLCTSGLGVGH